MVYLPRGQRVTVAPNRLSAPTAAGWWFNPRTGQASRLQETLVTTQPGQFVPPSSGQGNDWIPVLDVESSQFAPLG